MGAHRDFAIYIYICLSFIILPDILVLCVCVCVRACVYFFMIIILFIYKRRIYTFKERPVRRRKIELTKYLICTGKIPDVMWCVASRCIIPYLFIPHRTPISIFFGCRYVFINCLLSTRSFRYSILSNRIECRRLWVDYSLHRTHRFVSLKLFCFWDNLL